MDGSGPCAPSPILPKSALRTSTGTAPPHLTQTPSVRGTIHSLPTPLLGRIFAHLLPKCVVTHVLLVSKGWHCAACRAVPWLVGIGRLQLHLEAQTLFDVGVADGYMPERQVDWEHVDWDRTPDPEALLEQPQQAVARALATALCRFALGPVGLDGGHTHAHADAHGNRRPHSDSDGGTNAYSHRHARPHESAEGPLRDAPSVLRDVLRPLLARRVRDLRAFRDVSKRGPHLCLHLFRLSPGHAASVAECGFLRVFTPPGALPAACAFVGGAEAGTGATGCGGGVGAGCGAGQRGGGAAEEGTALTTSPDEGANGGGGRRLVIDDDARRVLNAAFHVLLDTSNPARYVLEPDLATFRAHLDFTPADTGINPTPTREENAALVDSFVRLLLPLDNVASAEAAYAHYRWLTFRSEPKRWGTLQTGAVVFLSSDLAMLCISDSYWD